MSHLTLEQCENLKRWGMPQSNTFLWMKTLTGTWQVWNDTARSEYEMPGMEMGPTYPTLEELLAWLESSLPPHDECSISLVRGWHSPTWTMDFENADWSKNLPRATYEGLARNTPLEAAYALCEAINAKA